MKKIGDRITFDDQKNYTTIVIMPPGSNWKNAILVLPQSGRRPGAAGQRRVLGDKNDQALFWSERVNRLWDSPAQPAAGAGPGNRLYQTLATA